MIEAYAGHDPAAYPYINGSISQADTEITVYPESHDLTLPREKKRGPWNINLARCSIMN